MNADGSNQINLTHNPTMDWYPSQSPDGSKIVFQYRSKNRKTDIYMINADGTRRINLTNNPLGYDWYPAWSPGCRK